MVDFRRRVVSELRSVGAATAYFGCWIGVLVVLKYLILAEYHIEFAGFAKAATGVLVLSKVVVLLEHVPLGARVERAPSWVEVLVRTALYAAGVLLALVTERLIHALLEGHEGLPEAFVAVTQSTEANRTLANTLAVTFALLVYNFLSVVGRTLGPGGLLGVLRRPVPPKGSAGEIEGDVGATAAQG